MSDSSNIVSFNVRRRTKRRPPENSAPSEACENCRFWEVDMFETDRVGNCRRYPPKFISDGELARSIGEDCSVFTGFFPETASWEWCGEWRSTTPRQSSQPR